MDLNLIVFLKDGKYRIEILKLLSKQHYLPSELATKLNINRASISRILKDLKDKELIISSSNNSRTIIYSITDLGKKILDEVKE